jgi:hypothetical protein
MFGTVAGGVFAWFFPNRKEWTETRNVKRDGKTDSRVLEAIGNYGLWTGPRPLTGAGIPAVQAHEMAEHLNLGLGAVADTLERLSLRGLVNKESGGLGNPIPSWNHVPR